MRKNILILFLLSVVSLSVFAVPAKRGLYKTIALADGSKVKVQLSGDEYVQYWCADDGRMFQKTETSDIYQQVSKESIVLQAKEGIARIHPERTLPEGVNRVPNRVPIDGTRHSFIGSKKCLCILVEFTDQHFKAEHTLDMYKNYINGVGYTNAEYGQIGSVRDYFLAQSNGMFDINFDVVGPFEMPYNTEYYGGNKPSGGDKNVKDMVKAAINSADPYVNFRDYDWNGDAICEAVFILYAGQGEADSGVENTIWPHQGSISYMAKDGVYISDYACGAELNFYNELTGIGTMCHEYSHCLGLPDMYDTASQKVNYGTNDWDLMCSGCYNGNSFIPAGYNAYERWYAGWLDYTELSANRDVESMKPLTSGGEAFVIYNDAHKNEYYLLENRALDGFDSALPNNGMLIYHVDYDKDIWRKNSVNNTSGDRIENDHPRFAVVACDNSYTYSNVKNDVYPGSGNTAFANTSIPASTLYHDNTDGTRHLSKPVTNIKLDDEGNISFHFENNVGVTPDWGSGVVLYESFDMCSGVGANDNNWKEASSAGFMPDLVGWDTFLSYAGYQCARFGSNTQAGRATTPEFELDGDYHLKFKAAPFYTDDANITVVVADGNAVLEGAGSNKMKTGAWTEYDMKLTGTGKVKIKFSAKKRFFLDEVKVVKDGIEDGIQNVIVADEQTEGAAYNLSGQRVKPGYKGVVIRNGRKYLKK